MPDNKDGIDGANNGETPTKKTEETPSAQDSVSPDEYQKVVENYTNMQSAYNKRDDEVSSLRAKVKELEGKKEEDGESKGLTREELREEIERMNADLEAKVERKIRLESQTKQLIADIAEAKKLPYVKEKEVLALIDSKKGNLSVKEALMLLYPQGTTKSVDEPIETDGGGRTIKTDSSSVDYKSVKMGFKGNFSDFISNRLQKRADEEAGVR